MTSVIKPTILKSDSERVPKADFPFRHCLPVQTRFSDIDVLGHLNNNVYFTFMDLAKIDYFTTIDPSINHSLRNIDMVVVHIDCDFIAPSYFGEQLEVWTAVTRIGRGSLTLEQHIINASTGQTKSVGRTVMAGFDPAAAKGMPLNPKWIAGIEAFEQRPLRSKPDKPLI